MKCYLSCLCKRKMHCAARKDCNRSRSNAPTPVLPAHSSGQQKHFLTTSPTFPDSVTAVSQKAKHVYSDSFKRAICCFLTQCFPSYNFLGCSSFVSCILLKKKYPVVCIKYFRVNNIQDHHYSSPCTSTPR